MTSMVPICQISWAPLKEPVRKALIEFEIPLKYLHNEKST